MKRIDRIEVTFGKRIICVAAALFIIGAASVAWADADPYEPDNTRSAAKTIAIGTSQIHTIDPVGDVDWIKFVPGPEPATYKVIIYAQTLALKGEEWVKIGKFPEIKVNPSLVIRKGKRLAVTVRTPGNVGYVKVSLRAKYSGNTGSYRVTLMEINP